MALSSGASGTTGFAFGTAGGEEKKEKKTVSVGQLVAGRRAPHCNKSARIIFYYLLICLPRRGKVIFACVVGGRGGGGGRTS